MSSALPADRMGDALASITAWRIDADQAVACPVCGELGLTVIDHSARPYSEWYVLSCTSCGLQHTVHIPMAPPL